MIKDKRKMITMLCDCRCSMFVVEKVVWDDGEINYNLSIQDSRYDHNCNSIWGRIKRAIKALTGKPYCFNEVLLSGKDGFHNLINDMEVLKKWGHSA